MIQIMMMMMMVKVEERWCCSCLCQKDALSAPWKKHFDASSIQQHTFSGGISDFIKSVPRWSACHEPDIEVGGKKGEGAAAEGYRPHTRRPALTILRKEKPDKVITCNISVPNFRTAPYPHKAHRAAGLHTRLSSSWGGLVFLAEVRS